MNESAEEKQETAEVPVIIKAQSVESRTLSQPRSDLQSSNIPVVKAQAVPVRETSTYSLPSSDLQSNDIFTEDQKRKLRELGFTAGLISALSGTKTDMPLRIWIVDNSGSMNNDGGHRVVETGGSSRDFRVFSSTRWAELQDCVEYHADLAALARAPTNFRLLNNPGSAGPQQFGIAETSRDETQVEREVQIARDVMQNTIPRGKTPLTQHILEIRQSLLEMGPQLSVGGKRVAIIIATDGLPTEKGDIKMTEASERFVKALKSLENFPIWLVIRLCTNQEHIVSYYQGLDRLLELPVELLDDFIGEAREVYRYNRWLNYGMPLHRCRELGFHDRVFDMIDERPLTKDQMRDVCSILFGEENVDSIPDPAKDWPGFMVGLNELMRNESEQWNPMKKMFMPWIDLKYLNSYYGVQPECQCDCTVT